MAEVENEFRGTRPFSGRGTEQNLRFGGSVAEVENEFGGTIYCSGHGTEHIIKFSGSVAERPSSVDWERDKI